MVPKSSETLLPLSLCGLDLMLFQRPLTEALLLTAAPAVSASREAAAAVALSTPRSLRHEAAGGTASSSADGGAVVRMVGMVALLADVDDSACITVRQSWNSSSSSISSGDLKWRWATDGLRSVDSVTK